MKNIYSYKVIIGRGLKYLIFALIITMGIGNHIAYGEGTKQLATKADDRVYLALNDSKYGNFGRYNGGDEERLYIHIEDPANEQVFFGFSRTVDSGHARENNFYNNVTSWIRIKDPNGNVVWPCPGFPKGEMIPGTNTNQTSDDQIQSLSQVKNGPNQLCGTGGYNAFVFNPTSGAGDYYIEFSASQSVPNNRAFYTEWWDITVATNSPAPEAIVGRVYAKQWSFVSPYKTTKWYDRDFNGKVYSYSESTSYSGGYVTEVDFENSGFRGARFNLAFNSKGTDDTPNFEVNRKSVQDANRLAPEFKIFFNEPDETAYPSAEGYGQFVTGDGSEYPRLFGCEGKYFFRVAVTKKGRIDLLLDFHGSNNKYDPGTRDRIITTLSNPFPNEAGVLIRDIKWDGLDGLGQVVSDLESNPVSCVFDYFLGTFHFPMYDVEHLTRGIIPRTVRPATPTSYTPKLYWDDRNIDESLPGGQLKVDLTGEKAPSHNWLDYDYGNENSINTYWHSYSSGVITSLLLEQTRDCALFQPGTISGTVYSDNDRDGVMDVGESPLLGAEVRLYWDKDYDKAIGSGDDLIETFITKTPGSFGYPEEQGNFILSPEIGKEYLVEVSYGSNSITGENPRSYKFYSSGVEYFDQNFGVVPSSKVNLSVSKTTILENGDNTLIVAELDLPSLLPVSIVLSYGGTADLTDYSLTPGLNAISSTRIDIPVGETRGEIDLASIQDILLEANETVLVEIVSVVNAIENGEQTATITIIDGNSAIKDLIDNDPEENTISENANVDDLVHITALATDEDGDAITYYLLDDAEGRFKIDPSTGVVSVADASMIDFETNVSHTIQIEAQSSDGSKIAEYFTVLISDVTDGDTDHAIANLIDNDPEENTISENANTDDLVHITALATDEDGDAITYYLLDDVEGRFKIDLSTGVVSVADASMIDFETDASHAIQIEARSSDGSKVAEYFTVLISDVTEGDTDHAITNLIDNDPEENTISENANTDDLVHITALATDQDGDAITYYLLDDAEGRFKIDLSTGVVSVADASMIDFETNVSHTIKVEARSSDGSKIAEYFTVLISDVTDGDTDHAIANLIDNDPEENTISENADIDDLVHITALATDEDGDAITYYLLDDAEGRFKVDLSTGVVSVADASMIDFETNVSHTIKVEARSSDGSKVAEYFTVLISDVTDGDTDHAITNLIDNDPEENTISENANTDDLVHITALATDEDGDAITYYLLDDAEGRFKIDLLTGVVSVADASMIDFETDASHAIQIEARSSDGSKVAEYFTVLISDVTDGDTDHPITDLRDNEEHENIISENVVNDAPVHITALATDLDNDPITYHLLDDDNGRFKIGEVSGVVTVKDESQIDFEANETHSIRIEARSADGSKISDDFPIFVTDVTNGDTDHAIANLIDNDSDENTISEDVKNDDLVHITALATDEDGDAITYFLLNDAGGRFKIGVSTGVVVVADANLLDFETDESHMIRIEARSSDGSTIAENFVITITDVIEYLLAVDDSSEVYEDQVLNGENLLANDFSVPGSILVIDLNPVVDVTHGELNIHADGTYTYTPDLNFNGTDSFVYRVCDDSAPQQCDEATVSVTIHSVNDAPLAMNDEAEVNEDEILNGLSVLDNDSDVDSNGLSINTSPIEDVEHGSLTINSDGTYVYIPDANYFGEDTFVYELCDNETSESCSQASVKISVLPVNDAPLVFDFEMEVKEASLNNPINLESPYDPDGDRLSVKILSTVEFGEIVQSDGQLLNDNDVLTVDELLNMEFNARERYVGELTMIYEVSDESGLSAIGRVKINVLPIDVFIPNAITPNSDNLNDRFKIVGLEKFPDNSLQIFNRWGNIVYKKRSYDNSWEGYGNVKGQISNHRLPPGTYYYVFKFGVKKQPLTGYVYMTY
ncbi:cadherin domain-containing protein [Ancylomarina sp. DW003]|nr:Ig-like domain-containing protein [Ancylomarina sp. DW003]MDE5420929.1 cadherin domain-containing protein [Ancylomarina sp. DW003]